MVQELMKAHGQHSNLKNLLREIIGGNKAKGKRERGNFNDFQKPGRVISNGNAYDCSLSAPHCTGRLSIIASSLRHGGTFLSFLRSGICLWLNVSSSILIIIFCPRSVVALVCVQRDNEIVFCKFGSPYGSPESH